MPPTITPAGAHRPFRGPVLAALTALALSGLAGCGPGPDTGGVRAETGGGGDGGEGGSGASPAAAGLDSVYAAFTRAYADADVRVLMEEVYADSAYYLPPGSPILHGQDQFRGQFAFLEPFARDGRAGPRITFEIVDRDIRDDLAYDIGTYAIRAPDAAGNGPATRGKFVVIWKRDEAGRWRIWADAYSPVE